MGIFDDVFLVRKNLLYRLFLGYIFCFFINVCYSQDSEFDLAVNSVIFDDLGYTLVGVKPASIQQSLPLYFQYYPSQKRNLITVLHEFASKSKDFILRVFLERDQIELLNRKSIRCQCMQNDRFRSFILKNYKSIDSFFDCIEKSEKGLFELLKYDHVIIAIILGYGEENGNFFVRRCELGYYLRKYPLVATYPFEQKPNPEYIRPYPKCNRVPQREYLPKIKEPFNSLEEEWKYIKSVERPADSSEKTSFMLIALPAYISRTGKESDIIHDKFTKARVTLSKISFKRHQKAVRTNTIVKK